MNIPLCVLCAFVGVPQIFFKLPPKLLHLVYLKTKTEYYAYPND